MAKGSLRRVGWAALLQVSALTTPTHKHMINFLPFSIIFLFLNKGRCRGTRLCPAFPPPPEGFGVAGQRDALRLKVATGNWLPATPPQRYRKKQETRRIVYRCLCVGGVRAAIGAIAAHPTRRIVPLAKKNLKFLLIHSLIKLIVRQGFVFNRVNAERHLFHIPFEVFP